MLLWAHSIALCQTFNCGTSAITSAENTTLIQGIESGKAQTAGSNIWNIPIWITYVRKSNGQSDWDIEFAPFALIENANQFYNNGFHFYLCGISYINNDDWYDLDLQERGALQAYADSINPQYDKGYIDLFLVGTLGNFSGLGYYPVGSNHRHVILAKSGNDGETLAHELGHYFSLLHTHEFGATPPLPSAPQNAQYVHDPTDPENHPIYLNGIYYSCSETGDYICDTPADPGPCQFNSCIFSYCLDPTDPLGLQYNPAPDLVMGPFRGCQPHFSAQQNQRMVAMYTANPSWSFIYDSIVPDCQALPSDVGFIQRNCKDIDVFGTPAPDAAPVEGVEVVLKDDVDQVCGTIAPITNTEGRYITGNCVYPSYDGNGLLSILPDKDYLNDPLNGVSTYDLFLIKEHVLGIMPFVNPFQFIAADANNSGSVTTFDISIIRSLILGMPNASLPAGSWRYIPDYCFDDQVFSDEFSDDDDPNTPGIQINPFNAVWTNPDEVNGQQRTYGNGSSLPNATSWMDHVSINPSSPSAKMAHPWSLWGVKTGDVNCSADIDTSSMFMPPNEHFIELGHDALTPNQEFLLQIRAFGETPVSAWQFGVDFAQDTLQILELLPGNTGEPFSTDNFGLWQGAQGEFRALNFDTTGTPTDFDNQILFGLKMKTLRPLSNIGTCFRLNNRVLEKKFYSGSGDEIEDMDLQLEVAVDDREIAGKNSDVNNIALESKYRLSVHPIPFYSELVFDFFLPEEQQVSLSLFDSFGRLISTTNTTLPKGTHSVRLYDLARQPAGLYLYRFESGQSNIYGKTVKN